MAIVRVVRTLIIICAFTSIARVSDLTRAAEGSTFVRTHGIFVTIVSAGRAFILIHTYDTVTNVAFLARAFCALALACTLGQTLRLAAATFVTIALVMFGTCACEGAICVLARRLLSRQLNRVRQTRVRPRHVLQFEINPLLFREVHCITFIHVLFTRLSDPSGSTAAIKVCEAIDTLATILARISFALIDLSTRLAVTFVASETFTLVISKRVLTRSPLAMTNAEVLAVGGRIKRALLAHLATSAFIHVLITHSTYPATVTCTTELPCAATKISAYTMTTAGACNAIVLVINTGSTIPSGLAYACERVRLGGVVGTLTVVFTRIGFAIINVFVTERSFKSTVFGTQARISLLCVDACSVDALLGFFVSAEILCHFAPLTIPALGAFAIEAFMTVNALTFHAWSFNAVDSRQVVLRTIIDGGAESAVAFKPSIALARVAAVFIRARCIGMTVVLPSCTLINVQRAILAFKGFWAVAFVIADEVDTQGVVLAVRFVGDSHLLKKSRHDREHKLSCGICTLVDISAFGLVANIVEVTIEIFFHHALNAASIASDVVAIVTSFISRANTVSAFVYRLDVRDLHFRGAIEKVSDFGNVGQHHLDTVGDKFEASVHTTRRTHAHEHACQLA